jgi:hypothetical protein
VKRGLLAFWLGLALACGGGGPRFQRIAAVDKDLVATALVEADAATLVVFG